MQLDNTGVLTIYYGANHGANEGSKLEVVWQSTSVENSRCDPFLWTNEHLSGRLALVSASGRFKAKLGSDGSLTVHAVDCHGRSSFPLWRTRNRMDSSGEKTFLTVQDDANVVLYRGTGEPDASNVLWLSNTHRDQVWDHRTLFSAARSHTASGALLPCVARCLHDADPMPLRPQVQNYFLKMQDDGMLGLYDGVSLQRQSFAPHLVKRHRW